MCCHCFYIVTARIAVVKPTGNPIICKTDEVGELVIQSPATGSAYWGLSGKTTTTFKVVGEGLDFHYYCYTLIIWSAWCLHTGILCL